jgi:hypothetical protein
MTYDDVILLAQKAGYDPEDWGRFKFDDFDLEQFAALVAAAPRQWVGLTEAEIAEWDYDVRDVVLDIEKLLRDRNT